MLAGATALACGVNEMPPDRTALGSAGMAATAPTEAAGGTDSGQVEPTSGGATAPETGGTAGASGSDSGGSPECPESGYTRQCWAQLLDGQTWCQGFQVCRGGLWSGCDCSVVVPGSGGQTSSGGTGTGGQSPSGGQPPGGTALGGSVTGGRATGGAATGGQASSAGTAGLAGSGGQAGEAGTAGKAGEAGRDAGAIPSCAVDASAPIVRRNVACSATDPARLYFEGVRAQALATASIVPQASDCTIAGVAVRNIDNGSELSLFCLGCNAVDVTYDPAVGNCMTFVGPSELTPCGTPMGSYPAPDFVLWYTEFGWSYRRAPGADAVACGTYEVDPTGLKAKVLGEYRIRL